MQDPITGTFHEWTKALTPEESRLRIFEKIRDIPYLIMPELFDFEKGPAKMLILNKGFCMPKHFLLGIMYEKLGIPVDYCIYAFKWSDSTASYPKGLRDMADSLPITYHLALRALLDGRYVFLDATWDPALKKANFPVNEKWDGRSDTMIAVKPISQISTAGMEETKKILKKQISAYSRLQKSTLFEFSDALNKWFMEIRKG